MKVLLVIDMQNASFNTDYPAFDAEGVIERINKLSESFRQKNYKVIFIQHNGSEEGFMIPGTNDWELLPSLVIKPEDLIIPKTANDSFYNTGLKELLQDLNADELIITGSATDFCVDSTVKSALTHEFNVTVVSDAHTTQGTPYLPANQVTEHYNWVWKQMSGTKSKIKVIDSDSIIKELTTH